MSQEIRSCLIDTCDIQRPDISASIATIRDRQVNKYDNVSTSVPCWFEPAGVIYNFDNRLGQQGVRTFNVHFMKGVDVREGDRLLKSSKYYLVQSVQDNSAHGFHIVAIVVEKNYAMGQ